MMIPTLVLCLAPQGAGPCNALGQPGWIEKEPVVLLHRVAMDRATLPIQWFSVEQWEQTGDPEVLHAGHVRIPAQRTAEDILVMDPAAVDAFLAGLAALDPPPTVGIPADPRMVLGWERASTLLTVQSGSCTAGTPLIRERFGMRCPPRGQVWMDESGELVEGPERPADEPPPWWQAHVFLTPDPPPRPVEVEDTGQATVGALRIEHDAAGDRGVFRAWEDGRPAQTWLCVGRSQDGERLWFWFEEGD